MSKINVIDDDFGIEALVDRLRISGHEVTRYRSAEEVLGSLGEVVSCDLIVLDLMMARASEMSEITARGGFRTGLVLLEKIREKEKELPVLVFSGAQDKGVQADLEHDRFAFFLSKSACISGDEIGKRIQSILGKGGEERKPQTFIVHGHDCTAKLELKNFLQNTLQLPEPIILHEQASRGKTIIEKLEVAGIEASIVFVLLTPDDRICADDATNEEKYQARQNVIFEMGYFMGLLGRKSGRLVLLYKGGLDLPSDIDGLIYVNIDNGIESAGESLRRELENAW